MSATIAAPLTRVRAARTTPSASTSTVRSAQPVHQDGRWVLAAPFRAHVVHLMNNAQVPWPAIAYQSGVPQATLRTLLFGRNGKARTKIAHHAASQLIALRPEDLRWMRVSQVSAGRAAARIRILRGRGIPWEQISAYLHLDVETCGAMARGERTSCSAMVDILAQAACESIGIHSWETGTGAASLATPQA
ncbi:MAG: hypothetical protein FWD75_03770 [Propionibacteriaceae bacterium]|nr:hypothetical protein [Propionibacteriaceae bacterium]